MTQTGRGVPPRLFGYTFLGNAKKVFRKGQSRNRKRGGLSGRLSRRSFSGAVQSSWQAFGWVVVKSSAFGSKRSRGTVGQSGEEKDEGFAVREGISLRRMKPEATRRNRQCPIVAVRIDTAHVET